MPEREDPQFSLGIMVSSCFNVVTLTIEPPNKLWLRGTDKLRRHILQSDDIAGHNQAHKTSLSDDILDHFLREFGA